MRLLRCGLIAAALLYTAVAVAEQGSSASNDNPGGWVRIVPQPVSINGRLYSPTCSQAPGTDPAFSYFFHKGTADGLVVFFNGGGACWNDATCSKPRLAGDRAKFSGKNDDDAEGVYKSELLPDDGPSHMTGILDSSDPRNPVRDWSMVFVPYCTADVHSGSNTATYHDPGTGKPFSIQHRGWDNMQVIMQWLRVNVPQTGHLLVSGSSAGAYGASTHYAALRELYPGATGVFLGDSGQGVSTQQFEEARDINWNYQLPASVFGPDAQSTPDREVVARLAAHFPRDRFAQFTTIQDATQTAFYMQMGAPRVCDAWTKAMMSELTLRQGTPNFRSYVAQGNTHTILRSPLFFTEQTGGTPFAEWLKAVLKDAQAPENATCANCQAPPEGCTP